MDANTHWFFLRFGLRRRTALRRTPAALQVDRANLVAPRPEYRGAQPAAAFSMGIEVRDGGLQYVRPLAA